MNVAAGVERDGDLARLIAERKRIGVALSPEELTAIVERLGRMPTDTELFAFDAQWSEHCSYKSSRRLLRKLPVDGPTVMRGPGEDAGIVYFGEWQGERYGIVIAHESHNHPSQVVPFEGAATGVGGIVRDVLCMGAEVIGIADPLRFGRLDDPHARYVAQSVVDGIAAYGNAIGVPNLGGDVYIDESFDDNVLVNVVAIGLIKERDIIHSRAPADSEGYDIVLVGKATDRSGFGGASFSSITLDEADAEANKSAVQVPDPFLKNVLMRASYQAFAEIRAARINVGYKDLGAGGFVGCSAELCAAGGKGAQIDLAAVPVSQDGLPAQVVAIGETQERMCWIVPPSFTPRLLAIYNDEFSLPQLSFGAAAAVVGRVTDTGRYVARYHGATVMDVELGFLTGGVRYNRPYTISAPNAQPVHTAHALDIGAAFEAVLAHRDVCSREAIFTRYDGVVRGCTAIPLGHADAGVLVPIDGAPLGAALAVAGNPRFGKLDPEGAAEHAVWEAIRNVVAVGARPLGLTDCLNFGDPTDPAHLGAMAAAIDGLATAARAFATPFVSGNVSLYNQSRAGHAVAPSPIVACVGVLDDISRVGSMGFTRADASVFAIASGRPSLGASVYADVVQRTGDVLGEIDYARARCAIATMLELWAGGVIRAAHDVSDGGLLVALAKMAFAAAQPLGVQVFESAAGPGETAEHGLFGEHGSFLVEVGYADVPAFHAVCARNGSVPSLVARTTGDPVFSIDAAAYARPMTVLRELWAAPLRNFYGDAA